MADVFVKDNCIFCRIAQGGLEDTELLFSDDEAAAFRDHRPAAQHHYLVVPKKHYRKISTLCADDVPMIKRLEEIGRQVLAEKVGAEEAQQDTMMGFHWPVGLVDHLHLHVIHPASSMGLLSRLIYSKYLMGSVEKAIATLNNKDRRN